ncbi:helix-turn-helix domain-containing protein [Ideonella livida]|uniref:Helix-turn-helix domain-containing protein n=1 Tax=Ideonella livida TaxID=2707176 RepID=A0A7C9PIM4_9BURK|nr:helix-turn-helix domain-containing protein [Ideonella livida]NDY92955.1 helix-turn-helix domain-containing protein [Ideonella livida]
MITLPSTPPDQPLPAYQLYGEPAPAQGSEPWHLETISARSRLHDWEIRPHRHEGFQQFLHLRSGQAQAWLDGRTEPLTGPCVVSVPPLAAHGFRFEPGVQGHVLTVQAAHLLPLLQRLGAADGTLLARLGQPAHLPLRRTPALARTLQALVDELAQEYTGHAPWRAQTLDALWLRWVLGLARALPDTTPAGAAAGPPRRAHDHLVRYRALVASRFHLQPRVSDLAAELGLTATQLNRVCRATAGCSALDLLHARLLLEAQRELAYTRQSIKQIALALGFADPAYFSRFFQRLCGQSPQAWREARRPASTPVATAPATGEPAGFSPRGAGGS